MSSHCGKLRVGDKGQRYIVCCYSKATHGNIVVGYTDREDGQPFKNIIDMHPAWIKPYTVDRQDGNKWTYL